METFEIGKYICYKQKIGKGSTSTVYKGYDKEKDIEVAIKKIEYSNIDKKIRIQIDRETKLMKSLTHPNIVELYDIVYLEDSPNFVYLILEYCHQGDLSKFLNKRPMKEKYAKKYMKHLLAGLKYLIENNIIHRDLKPQNIMVTKNDTLKICDFGFARHFDSNMMLNTLCGTPLYMAPEILTYSNYTNKADLWSIGVILYEILFAQRPYSANSFYNLVQQIKEKPIKIPEYIAISTCCQDLLKSLLVKDPKKRISWEGFFNHPWFVNKVHIYKPFEQSNTYDSQELSFDVAFSYDKESSNNFKSYESTLSSIENCIETNNETDNETDKKINKAIPIPQNNRIKENYIQSNSDLGTSPIFKSIDNNDFIIVESPQERHYFSEPNKNGSIVGNMQEYINMSIDLLKNSFNYVNEYKSI